MEMWKGAYERGKRVWMSCGECGGEMVGRTKTRGNKNVARCYEMPGVMLSLGISVFDGEGSGGGTLYNFYFFFFLLLEPKSKAKAENKINIKYKI